MSATSILLLWFAAISSSLLGQGAGPVVREPDDIPARALLPPGRLVASQPPVLALPSLKSDDVRRAAAPEPDRAIGAVRAMPYGCVREGEWISAPTGERFWRLTIRQAGAKGLRVRFSGFAAGAGRVWVYGAGDEDAEILPPYTGGGLHGDGEFWSHTVFSDSAIVEYVPEDNARAEGRPPFQIAEALHLWESPWEGPRERALAFQSVADGLTPRQAAECHLDASCFQHEPWEVPILASAHYTYVRDGQAFACSGTLVNATYASPPPLFLTANHCITDESAARTMDLFFNYQTEGCNAPPPPRSRAARVQVGTLLAGGPAREGDWSLVRLSRFPDTRVALSGWTADEPALGGEVAAVTHPEGSHKRIAFGVRIRDRDSVVDGRLQPAEKYYVLDLDRGTIEPGSSGGGVFDGRGSLIGVVSAGAAGDACAPGAATRGGRFAAMYPSIASYLENPETFRRGGEIAATPNPIRVPAGSRLGRTTLTWRASGVEQVQIRILSPAGPLLTGLTSAIGSAETGDWVADGTSFFLQDASDGESSGSSRTLAVATARVVPAAPRGTLLADPNPVIALPGRLVGRTALRWTASGVSAVQIRVGSPSGAALTGPMAIAAASSGVAHTADWVVDGTEFYLQDASGGDSSGAARTLAVQRVQVHEGP
ncbi:MAG: trypsin-like peptidase domain-containing protein [Bryobacteraceae bacterium]